MRKHAGLLFLLAGLFCLGSWQAMAGEVAKYNQDFAQAYAHLRQALVAAGVGKSDKGSVDKAIKAMVDLDRQWSAFAAAHKKPPPHFSEEKAWEQTMARTRALIAKAGEAVKRASLDDAYDALEEVRSLLGDLRRRNNVIVFSDHVNAYNEQMEEILGAEYGQEGFDAAQRIELIEQLAVLSFLAEAMERNAPAAYGSDQEFVGMIEVVFASIDKVRQAVDENDKKNLINALSGLRPAFARLFLKFG